MSDRKQNESVSHALLALGIVALLIASIIIAWVIVCCERCRRKRKYRPGQQNRRSDPGGGGSITRSGPSPSISRHLLVPKASEHLVIANKAFLSKSTPHLVGVDGDEEDNWRMEGISTPTPSEPLIPSPSKRTSSRSNKPVVVAGTSSRHANIGMTPVPRSRSEPVLQDQGVRKSGWEEQGSFQELSIHDQIAAILGTFPNLSFEFFKPTKNSTPLKNETDSDVEQGPESSVDGDVLVPLDVTTPLTTGDKRQLNNNKINKNIVRPTTLTFVEEKRYDFIDVEVEIDTKVGEIHENEDDLPPLLETVL